MHDLFAINFAWLIPLLPLIGAGISGFFGAKLLKSRSHLPIWIGVGASAVLSAWLLFGMLGLWSNGAGTQALGVNVVWFDWITVGALNAQAGAWIDPLTAVMLCVVTVIGFLICIFSRSYMLHEPGYFRFFAYLGLFIFMMTILVMGNNLIMLYLGWEGVGLCSYLLIGHYYEKPAAREAAKKAFLVNRVGDFGFALGIMLCFWAFGTVTWFTGGPEHDGLLELAQNPDERQAWALQFIPFLLMVGAFGKSAQFPLHVWLPDAMEGPTPVSALIHAATMVTAGVYMIARCGTLFVGNDAAMWTVVGIGAFTALFAATIALRQFDLKKILAYSTISQLGFMFVGVGVLAPVAGVFHLVTHAFFKALLFLGAGVVMHAMAGELDMRKLSGLKRVLPFTRWLMLIGCLALAGFPLFSGFFSKDEILTATWARSPFIGLVMLITALITAYYTFRLYFRVFEGPLMVPEASPPAHGRGHEPHEHATASVSAIETDTAPQSGVDVGQTHREPAEHDHHGHEPTGMTVPLVVLAIGALLVGWINFPERAASLGGFLGQSLSFSQTYSHGVRTQPEVNPLTYGQFSEAHDMKALGSDVLDRYHHIHNVMMIASALVALTGIYLAYLLHLKYRQRSEEIAARLQPVTNLIEAKYWVDEIYQAVIVEPLRVMGRVFFAVDRFVIDGLLWLIAFVPQATGFALKWTTQRGYLQGYAASMVAGVLIILLWLLVLSRA